MGRELWAGTMDGDYGWGSVFAGYGELALLFAVKKKSYYMQ